MRAALPTSLLALTASSLVLGDAPASSVPHTLFDPNTGTKLNTTFSSFTGRYPQVTDQSGQWILINNDQWTSGFQPAMLYEMHRRQTLCPNVSDRVDWLSEAQKWTSGLLNLTNGNSAGHDQGFLSFPFVEQLKLTPNNDTVKQATLKFADILASRFNSVVGCTRSWDGGIDPTDFRVIIDNMMNLELLFVASDLTGNKTYEHIATSHANTTMRNHFRHNVTAPASPSTPDDWSTWHLLHYNSTNGDVFAKVTSQGYANDSTWTRGQAWAMLGFAQVYNRTGNNDYLETSRLASKLFLSRLPSSGVPPWDFDAPGSPATADTSAGSIAADALIYLATIERSLGNSTGETYYIENAMKILNGISNLAFKGPQSPTWQSILSNGTANFPVNSSQTGLIYGDYYWVKAGNDLINHGYASCDLIAVSTNTSQPSGSPNGGSHSAGSRQADLDVFSGSKSGSAAFGLFAAFLTSLVF